MSDESITATGPGTEPGAACTNPSAGSDAETRAAWAGVSAAFAALGRAFVCVDVDFRIVHGSAVLDEILGAGAAEAVAGLPLAAVLGDELFGTAGAMRQALLDGERREGWRGHLRLPGREPRLVSLSAAPFVRPADAPCDPRVAYVVVLRPAETDRGLGVGAPTAMGGGLTRSPAMHRVYTLIENLRHSEATVLITGESGTGKEIVARALHEHSPRSVGPFVPVNCGALPADLLESEMFGHIRGAFTGAVRDREGRFAFASEGTLFLDEVGDLPLALQVKLLRVLQDGTYQRLGENQTRRSRARVVAATHVDLARAVRAGRFREDLFYRLRVVPIDIPPLRDRREDIEPLARTLLARVSARHGRALQFSPDALRVLLRHDWPGNVRELENALEYALAVCRGQTLLPEDLPESLVSGVFGPGAADRHGATDLGAQPAASSVPDMRPAELASIRELRRVLDAVHWRRDEAARVLGISRTTLWRRMREAGLE